MNASQKSVHILRGAYLWGVVQNMPTIPVNTPERKTFEEWARGQHGKTVEAAKLVLEDLPTWEW
jgi:hypothetical protein